MRVGTGGARLPREVTKRVYATTVDADEHGYMRAGWDEVGDWLRVHPATHELVRRVISVYGDREELQADAAVYARVLQAVRAVGRFVHVGDGVTEEDVIRGDGGGPAAGGHDQVLRSM